MSDEYVPRPHPAVAAEHALAACRIRRYHTVPAASPVTQSVGEHTCGVILLLNIMYRCMNKRPSSELFIHAALHDFAELVTGDLPAPFKRKLPHDFHNDHATIYEMYGEELYGLTQQEFVLLKLADNLEGFMYSWSHPDPAMDVVTQRYFTYINELVAMHLGAEVTDEVLEFINHVMATYDN